MGYQFDFDGDNDLILSGESGTDITLIYRNDGNDFFTEMDLTFLHILLILL